MSRLTIENVVGDMIYAALMEELRLMRKLETNRRAVAALSHLPPGMIRLGLREEFQGEEGSILAALDRLREGK